MSMFGYGTAAEELRATIDYIKAVWGATDQDIVKLLSYVLHHYMYYVHEPEDGEDVNRRLGDTARYKQEK